MESNSPWAGQRRHAILAESTSGRSRTAADSRLCEGCKGVSRKSFSHPTVGACAALAQNWQAAIWNREGRLIRLLDVRPGLSADNAGLAFSPDGHLFVCSAGYEAKLWDLESGAERGSWVLPGGLCDLPVFRGPDRLMLCRVETKDGRARR